MRSSLANKKEKPTFSWTKTVFRLQAANIQELGCHELYSFLFTFSTPCRHLDCPLWCTLRQVINRSLVSSCTQTGNILQHHIAHLFVHTCTSSTSLENSCFVLCIINTVRMGVNLEHTFISNCEWHLLEALNNLLRSRADSRDEESKLLYVCSFVVEDLLFIS